MDKSLIGVLHPGEMGAAVGACLSQRGLTVLWASAGRSPATADRAAAAGMRDAGTAGEMSGQAEVILSVCPPHAALEVARSVAGFSGIYVDANAVSPATTREVAEIVTGRRGPLRGRRDHRRRRRVRPGTAACTCPACGPRRSATCSPARPSTPR